MTRPQPSRAGTVGAGDRGFASWECERGEKTNAIKTTPERVRSFSLVRSLFIAVLNLLRERKPRWQPDMPALSTIAFLPSSNRNLQIEVRATDPASSHCLRGSSGLTSVAGFTRPANFWPFGSTTSTMRPMGLPFLTGSTVTVI